MKAVAVILSAISLIPGLASVSRGNGAVCLYDSTDIEVKKNLTAVVRVYRTLEITTEAGARFAELVLPVNDYIIIEDIEGRTILPGGREVELKEQDIQRASAEGTRDFGGIEVVMISLRSPVVGARLTYSYKMDIKSLLYLPRLFRDTSCPTKRLAVRLRWHKDVTMNYDYSKLNVDSSNREVMFFADDLPELPSESFACPDSLYLLLTADVFSYKGTKYYSRTWADVGRFFALQDRESSGSLEEVNKLGRRLAAGALTREDTVKTIFGYVADSVSYVPLEIGRGGFDPHSCGLIIKRRYGDCKDQSVLLKSLLGAVGIEASLALVYTGRYPDAGSVHPWPAIFDHAVVVVDDQDGELILDPSDPLSAVGTLPPGLRDRAYLPADGYSGLRMTASGPLPATGIVWSYVLRTVSDSVFIFDFTQDRLNDAASAYIGLEESGAARLKDLVESDTRMAGWMLSSMEVDEISAERDSVSISGSFRVSADDIGPSGDMKLGSPLVEYLLVEMFQDVREGDYCRDGSILLEETVSIPSFSRVSVDMAGYSDVWLRDSFEFSDELSLGDQQAVFHRAFKFTGSQMGADDFNSFRDFLLSARNQRYVRIQK
jgi:transglutaminase-like putative cysteine protease